jgi:hypothetical protein
VEGREAGADVDVVSAVERVGKYHDGGKQTTQQRIDARRYAATRSGKYCLAMSIALRVAFFTVSGLGKYSRAVPIALWAAAIASFWEGSMSLAASEAVALRFISEVLRICAHRGMHQGNLAQWSV